ncbi:hypothetical protein IAT38_001979 [Cryptococcus sp. DSM 104549]
MPLKLLPFPIIPVARRRIAARHISTAPPRYRRQQLDYLAPFRRPTSPPPSASATSLQNVLQTPPQPDHDPTRGSHSPFETSSTAPVASSLQEVPSQEERSKVVDPVPAMKGLGGESSAGAKDAKGGARRTKEMYVGNIAVPPKPVPPGEEECCMSGCVNCVYTIYTQELEEYVEAIDAARAELEATGVPRSEWPEEIARDGRGDAIENEEKDSAKAGMDPAMSAFLALEGKLKKK